MYPPPITQWFFNLFYSRFLFVSFCLFCSPSIICIDAKLLEVIFLHDVTMSNGNECTQSICRWLRWLHAHNIVVDSDPYFYCVIFFLLVFYFKWCQYEWQRYENQEKIFIIYDLLLLYCAIDKQCYLCTRIRSPCERDMLFFVCFVCSHSTTQQSTLFSHRILFNSIGKLSINDAELAAVVPVVSAIIQNLHFFLDRKKQKHNRIMSNGSFLVSSLSVSFNVQTRREQYHTICARTIWYDTLLLYKCPCK